MNEFFVGQDLRITLDMRVVVTGAACKVEYRTPLGVEGYWAGIVSTTNSKRFYHDATPAELVSAGIWTFWGTAVLPGGKTIIGKIATLLIKRKGT
jgi:hypothetical protein